MLICAVKCWCFRQSGSTSQNDVQRSRRCSLQRIIWCDTPDHDNALSFKSMSYWYQCPWSLYRMLIERHVKLALNPLKIVIYVCSVTIFVITAPDHCITRWLQDSWSWHWCPECCPVCVSLNIDHHCSWSLHHTLISGRVKRTLMLWMLFRVCIQRYRSSLHLVLVMRRHRTKSKFILTASNHYAIRLSSNTKSRHCCAWCIVPSSDRRPSLWSLDKILKILHHFLNAFWVVFDASEYLPDGLWKVFKDVINALTIFLYGFWTTFEVVINTSEYLPNGQWTTCKVVMKFASRHHIIMRIESANTDKILYLVISFSFFNGFSAKRQ